MDGLALLGKGLVVGTEFHVDYPLSVSQATVADIGGFTVRAEMNLPVDICGRNSAQIFILICPEELQHLVQAQTHDAFQQDFMGVLPSLEPHYHSYGLNGETAR